MNFFVTRVILNISTDEFNGAGFSLGLYNSTLLVFLSLVDDVFCSFGDLLGDLLRFNGIREFLSESQMGDGNIIQNNVELLGSAFQGASDGATDLISLRK